MRRASIGGLRRRAVLEQPLDVPDEIGGLLRTWTPVATVWAQVLPLAGVERREGGREETAITHRVLIRWRPDVTGASRLVVEGRVLAVHAAVDHDPQRRFMMLQCQEIA